MILQLCICKIMVSHMPMVPSLSSAEYPYMPRRIALARAKTKLSQDELSKQIGFKDRQTLATVEAGQRRVTAEELVSIAEATGQPLSFFTDPFLLAGEGRFSYRSSGALAEDLDTFEEQVGRWLALWRRLGELRKETPALVRPRLPINLQSTYEEAQAAGEAVRRWLDLSEVPSKELVRALEEKFHLLVLDVDMPEGVSGVAVQLASGDAILINHAEPPGRQAFDRAHELFHVLTWDALPPERVDRLKPTGSHQKRMEQLADNFAAALLMPEAELRPRWIQQSAQVPCEEALRRLAEHFGVSVPAVGWRLVTLGELKKGDWLEVPGQSGAALETTKPLFSRPFVERAAWAIEHGELSVKRLLDLLGLNLDEFQACCQAHGVSLEIGL